MHFSHVDFLFYGGSSPGYYSTLLALTMPHPAHWPPMTSLVKTCQHAWNAVYPVVSIVSSEMPHAFGLLLFFGPHIQHTVGSCYNEINGA